MKNRDEEVKGREAKFLTITEQDGRHGSDGCTYKRKFVCFVLVDGLN